MWSFAKIIQRASPVRGGNGETEMGKKEKD